MVVAEKDTGYVKYVIIMSLVQGFAFIILVSLIFLELGPDMKLDFPSPDPHLMTPGYWVLLFGLLTAADLIILMIHAAHTFHQNEIKAKAGRYDNLKDFRFDLSVRHNVNVLVYNITIPRILFFIVILAVYVAGITSDRFFEYLSIYLPFHLPFLAHLALLITNLAK